MLFILYIHLPNYKHRSQYQYLWTISNQFHQTIVWYLCCYYQICVLRIILRLNNSICVLFFSFAVFGHLFIFLSVRIIIPLLFWVYLRIILKKLMLFLFSFCGRSQVGNWVWPFSLLDVFLHYCHYYILVNLIWTNYLLWYLWLLHVMWAKAQVDTCLFYCRIVDIP
jgi:hypothetical protein